MTGAMPVLFFAALDAVDGCPSTLAAPTQALVVVPDVGTIGESFGVFTRVTCGKACEHAAGGDQRRVRCSSRPHSL